MKYYLLTTDGAKRIVSPRNGPDFAYSELYGILGGNYRTIGLSRGNELITRLVDDIASLPANRAATEIYWKSQGITQETIGGDAVYVERKK